MAKAIWGPASSVAAEWATARHAELDDGRLDDLLLALRIHAPACDDARKFVGYLERNRNRMDDPAFRAKGPCTYTGVVEAGCKLAIGTRLERAGMHWTASGADTVIALRCSRLSGRFEDIWEKRAA